MPFAYNRLPDALRAKVSYVSLMGFAPTADFQIRVTGWLGMPASDKALPVEGRAVEAAARDGAVHLRREGRGHAVSDADEDQGIEAWIRLQGDHHFGGDYDVLAKRILGGWQKQIAARNGA